MTHEELQKLTKIRDDAKGSFWDFDKLRVMARLDQFIADAAHELEQKATDGEPRGEANQNTGAQP